MSIETRHTTWTLLRAGGRPLLALLLVALTVKLMVAFSALSGNPLARHATSDSRYYVDRALGLLGRIDDPLASQPYHLPPLYPWVLRLVPGFGEGSYQGVVVLQALAGTAMLAGVYVLARRRMGTGGALLATALTLLYWPLTFYETKVLGDSLATSLIVGLLVATDAFADRPSHARAVLAGLLVAVVALLRPQALLLVPVLLLWIVWRFRPFAPAYAVSVCAMLLPFTLHNARTSGDLILVSNNGGVNLWLANSGPVSGTFEIYDPRFFDIDRQAQVAKEVAEDYAGRLLSPSQVSSILARRALAEILRRPRLFARRIAARARALLESFETDIVSIPPVESTTISALRLLILPFWVLAGLATAAVLLRARWSTGPVVPMWAVAAMVVLTTFAYFHYSRFRLPLVPLFALMVGAAWELVRAGGVPPRRWFDAAIGFVGVALVSLQPAPHHTRTLANGWTSLGQARLTQTVDSVQLNTARAEVRRALELVPGFTRAHVASARIAVLLRDYDAADTHLLAAEAVLPEYPPVLLERALLAAYPDASNRHHDPERARRLVTLLAGSLGDDPKLSASLDQVRRLLSH